MAILRSLLLLCALPAALASATGSSRPQGLSPAASAEPVSAAAASGPGLRAGFDEGLPIDIQGESLRYQQSDETLLAEGDVVLESAGARIHADRLWYDLKKGVLRAEGKVVVSEGGNTLWAERATMDQVSRTGEAQDLLYEQAPWRAACGEAKMLEGGAVLLKGCECSTCRQENPYWRLSASEIKVQPGERFWAWGVWVHAGRVPVFYLPYFTHSLKDPRPPIEIKPGYTRSLGAYIRTAYNYYLSDGNYGSVRYDWMDKKGNGYGLGQHYKLFGGEGDLEGYVAVDKNDPSRQDFSGQFKHSQDLGGGLSLLANLEAMSNEAFNETYDQSALDVFRRRSYLSLRSQQATYSWAAEASETQLLQVLPDGLGGVASREMVVVERQLPGFSFNRPSQPVSEGSSLYWGADAALRRSLVVPRMLLTATATEAYDTQAAYYQTEANLTPNLSQSLRLGSRLGAAANLSLSQAWRQKEGDEGYGQLPSTYGTWFELSARPFNALDWSLGHRYRRQVNFLEDQRWAGEQLNQMETRLRAQVAEPLSLMGSVDYDLRPWRTDSDLKRLGPLRLQASLDGGELRSLGLSSSYHVPTGSLKTVDGWANLNGPDQSWMLNLGGHWVNNRIVPALPSLDSAAPLELRVEDPRQTPDQLSVSLRCTLELGPKWKASFYERLDLTSRRLEEQAFALYRDLGCLDIEISARETRLGGWQAGFALSLRSVPNVKVNSNQVAAEIFEPIQYGY